MIKEEISSILKELLPDEDFKSDMERLVLVGTSSLLSLSFITAIEEGYDIEIENDSINHKFFSDMDYIEKIISESQES